MILGKFAIGCSCSNLELFQECNTLLSEDQHLNSYRGDFQFSGPGIEFIRIYNWVKVAKFAKMQNFNIVLPEILNEIDLETWGGLINHFCGGKHQDYLYFCWVGGSFISGIFVRQNIDLKYTRILVLPD